MSEGMYTLADQIAELRRELNLRPRVYSRWVSDGRMTQAQCDERIGRMRAALKTLEALLEALRDEELPEAAHGGPPLGVASTEGLGASAPAVRQIGLATLYLGDARHVLHGVRADVVITDPVWPNCPAGLLPGANGMQGALTRLALDILLPVRTAVLVLGFDSDPRWLAEAVPPELPYIRSQQLPYAFPGYRGRLLAGDEMAYVFGCIPTGRGVIPGRARTKTKAKERSAHPCPRQEVHMESLVGWWSLEGDTVADPFMGTGTTGVAAVAAGRRFVGAEIDRGYFDLACERIERAQRQQTLPLTPNVGGEP